MMADISETVPHFKAKFRVDTEETWTYWLFELVLWTEILQHLGQQAHIWWNRPTRLSLGMWPLIQIRLVGSCGQQDQSKSQIQIQSNRGIFDWAALLICCQNSQWLEPALCCCCWAEFSCLQSSVGQICTCRMSHAMTHYHH